MQTQPNWFIVQILWQAQAQGQLLGQRLQWRLIQAAACEEARSKAMQMAANETRAATQLHLPLQWHPHQVTAVLALQPMADGSELCTTYHTAQLHAAAQRHASTTWHDNSLAFENGS